MVLRAAAVALLGLLAISSASVLDTIERRRDIDEDCPLCDYVYEDDGMFSYEIMDVEQQDGFTTYFLNMTSQQWLDESFSNHPIWWHYMAVHVPDGQRQVENAAFLYSSYRSNDNSPPDVNSDHVRQTGDICEKHSIVTAVVQQIPNQPVIFTEDDTQKSRWEDDLIAWTWLKFLEDEQDPDIEADPRILARNPMCKGSVRAMDAITLLVNELDGTVIEDFVIAGESKRGWTTWIAGAIDERVVAMIPVVLTCLNMRENFHHYYMSYGGWPYYLWDYWSKGLMAWLDEPEMDALAEVIDPYTYREWMTMPKLIVASSSDEFFMPDDSHYFFDDLPGETHLWLLDNSGHSIGSSPHNADYWEMLGTYTMSVLLERSRPNFTWERSTDEEAGTGTITLSSPDEAPLEIEAYWADSVVDWRREWRLKMLNYSLSSPPPDGNLPAEVDTGIVWEAVPVQDEGDGTYTATFDYPDGDYYRAFFIKVVYDGQGGDDYMFTTETHIIPDGFPYDRCSTPDECRGWLW